jgi:hypothetical protein
MEMLMLMLVAQACKEGGHTTPSWNAPAVLKWKQSYADMHVHISCIIFTMEMLMLMLVAQNKFRPVRRVVKQLPAEMLQQCSSGSSLMWICMVTEEHYTTYHHSMSFVLKGPMQCFLVFHNTLLIFLWFFLHEFQHQYSFPSPTAFWQTFVHTFFGLFDKYVSTTLTAVWFQHS